MSSPVTRRPLLGERGGVGQQRAAGADADVEQVAAGRQPPEHGAIPTGGEADDRLVVDESPGGTNGAHACPSRRVRRRFKRSGPPVVPQIDSDGGNHGFQREGAEGAKTAQRQDHWMQPLASGGDGGAALHVQAATSA